MRPEKIKEMKETFEKYENGDSKDLYKFIIRNYYFFAKSKIIFRKRINFKDSQKSGYIEFYGNTFCGDYKVPQLMYVFDKKGNKLLEIDLDDMWNSVNNIYFK